MNQQPLAIAALGMMTSVGLNARSSCAAMRAGIQNATETRFVAAGGEPLMGMQVPLERMWRGRSRLVRMLTPCIAECLAAVPGASFGPLPLLLCVAETGRPGRDDGLDDTLFHEIAAESAVEFSQSDSAVIPMGRAAIATAMVSARRILYEAGNEWALIAATDSLLVGETLSALEDGDRLLSAENSNGFIPGEAAAAVLLRRGGAVDDPALCLGVGMGTEHAPIDSEQPLRADGLVSAIRAATIDAGCEFAQLDFRIADLTGEHYYFKEAALAQSRLLRTTRGEFPLWHPADCIGEVGASFGLIATGLAATAFARGYSPGPLALVHSGSDAGARAAVILKSGRN